MIFSWKKKKNTKSVPAKSYSSPAGKRAYAIGDVHGCFNLMTTLLDKIEVDIKIHNDIHGEEAQSHIIFLGDLIDRGPNSAGVIEFLINYQPDFARIHFVAGNHEESIVRALSGESNLLMPWLEHGGFATSLSYGLDPASLRGQPAHILEHMIYSAIPRSHIKFLSGFADSVQFGDYFFCHAGVRPGIPISDQDPKDLKWVRAEFLDSTVNHGAMIVHGHTIVENVEEKTNRIALDTGAYTSGLLSALCVEGETRRFIQTSNKNDR